MQTAGEKRSMWPLDWGQLFRRRKRAEARRGCPHVLGQHLTRTSKSTLTYRDGGARPTGQRGGRVVVDQAECVWAPGHAGVHKTDDGRTWS
jgi:hypothetical protein